MKIAVLVLGALSLASLIGAQNGNDPLILNNRTGLAPIVYDKFTTSYTSSTEPVRNDVSVPVTLSPTCSNTFVKSTAPFKCWYNAYPCGTNGGQRSQRRVATCADATAVADEIIRRVPPPEFFSSRPDVPLPGQTDVSGETGDVSFGIVPIPTSLAGDKQYEALPQPSETGEAIFSILPIFPTPSSEHIAVPTGWWRGFCEAASTTNGFRTSIPTEWWRTPSQTSTQPHTSILTEWWRNPTQQHFPLASTDACSYTLDCHMHYFPSEIPTVFSRPPSPILPHSDVPSTLTLTTFSHFPIPPDGTPVVEASSFRAPNVAGVPIEWWRGPGQSIVPNAPGPVQSQELSVSVPPSFPSVKPVVGTVSTDRCFRHYCPTGGYTTKVGKSTRTTLHTVTKPDVTGKPSAKSPEVLPPPLMIRV